MVKKTHLLDGGTEKEIIEALDEAAAEGSWGYVPLSGPYIDVHHSANVTARVGATAVLNCRVHYIVGKPVSWMRSRDLHLLTVGRFTYTSDDRFRAVHQAGSQDWLLKIHYLQIRDAGAYECQVATTPPMTHTVYLSVVEPQTVVLGGPDLYINAGSAINLTCLVKNISEPPSYIFWYHDEELLTYDSERGDVTVVTSRDVDTTSQLLIQQAKPSDSGQYTCSPSTAPPHTVTLHVINSEEPAAIHHKNTTSNAVESGTQRLCPEVPLLLLAFLSLFGLTWTGGGRTQFHPSGTVDGIWWGILLEACRGFSCWWKRWWGVSVVKSQEVKKEPTTVKYLDELVR
ncbi:hypothetical protein SK128_008610 [Halocaridina rubra]|uniref:Ig-like domain-containing protein n=1 Tax=Halocaridina rubra TaxID=373956 RepID=A0AAN8WRB3_HALRR